MKEFKRITEKINELEYYSRTKDLTEKGIELLAELKECLQFIQTVVVGRIEQDCDVCRPITECFYLGGTCQKCLKPFLEFKQS